MMFYTPQRIIDHINLNFNNEQIELVDAFTFLSITFDTHDKWKQHKNTIANQINVVIANLNKWRSLLHQRILVAIYNLLILSRINFGLLTEELNIPVCNITIEQ